MTKSFLLVLTEHKSRQSTACIKLNNSRTLISVAVGKDSSRFEQSGLSSDLMHSYMTLKPIYSKSMGCLVTKNGTVRLSLLEDNLKSSSSHPL